MTDKTRILIDTNALADLFVGEPALERAAQELRRAFPDWIAPPLIRYEFGNVLRTYVKLGHTPAADASAMLLKGLGMVTFCEEPTADAVLAEGDTSSLTFYDATYVACARSTGLRLFTRDKAILKQCSDVARPIDPA